MSKLMKVGIAVLGIGCVFSVFGQENIIKNGNFESSGSDGLPKSFSIVAEGDPASVQYVDRGEGKGKCVSFKPTVKMVVLRQEIEPALDTEKEYVLTAEIKSKNFEGTGQVLVINGGWQYQFGIISAASGNSDWQKITTKPFKVKNTNGKYYLVAWMRPGDKGEFSVANVSLAVAEKSGNH